MKSITIHNLDDDIEEKVLELSKKWDLSLNKTIKKLLRKTLGLEGEVPDLKKYDKFYGTWSKEEADSFEESIQIFNVVDDEAWG